MVRGVGSKEANLLRPITHYEAPPQLALTPPQSSFPPYTVNGNLFAFNTTSGDYAPSFPKSTPDFYAPPSTTPDDPLPNINNLTDPNTRANALGFQHKKTQAIISMRMTTQISYLIQKLHHHGGRKELGSLVK